MNELNPRNTRIYQRGLELIAVAVEMESRLPRGWAELGDQAKRAATSVVLNFVEGTGYTSAKKRRYHFTIAKASAREVMAAVEVANSLGFVDASVVERAADLADHLGGMLHKYR